MNRTALGLIALLLLIVGVITLWQRGPADEVAAPFAAGCLRVGLVLGALWLALPQIMGFFSRAPRWLLVATVIAVVIAAVTRNLLFIAVGIPVLGLLWFLGPRLASKADKPIVPQKRPRRRSDA